MEVNMENASARLDIVLVSNKVSVSVILVFTWMKQVVKIVQN